ncbi:MAG: hypothetical protein HUU02_15155 [Bacteroidetes bacterium]|nr:hypothetical protein [Bacteroidota bacterium]
MRSFFLLFCIASLASAQFGERTGLEDTLAMVDGHAVTSRDLFERVSLMPFEEKVRERDFSAVKRKAVESLVGEYLLAEMSRPDDSTEWKARFERTVMEHLFVRDALFKRQVRERVRITDEETALAMRQYAVRKRLLVAKFSSEAAASKFVKQWKQRAAADTAGRRTIPDGALQHDTLLISFGSADSILERAAYSLTRKQQIAGPVRSVMFGLVIAVLLEDEPNPAATGRSFVDRHKIVTDMLRERKESQLQSALLAQLLRAQQMQADTTLFYDAAERMHNLMMRDTSARRVPVGYRYLADDITSMMFEFRPQLDSAIIRGTFGAVPLGIFLEHLYFYEFSFPSMRPRLFVPSFFQLLRTVAESELIAKEGYARGLNYDVDVRREMGVWDRYRRSRLAEYTSTDTIMTDVRERLRGDTLFAASAEGKDLARIRAGRQADRVSSIIAAEALRRRVMIDYERIDRTEIPDVNMITRRTIGFGGKMNAAPMLFPQWRWVEEWNRMKETAP